MQQINAKGEDEMYKEVTKHNEFESWDDTIKYIDDAESWDIVADLMEDCCEALDIDSSEFDDPDFLFEDIRIHAGCAPELTKEQIEFYKKPEFDGWMRTEIYMGFQDGLTIDQIKLYAKPEFNSWQMREIREGFQDGLTIDQIKLYAKPEFDSSQMREIREGFKSGLSQEQVQLYAKPEFDYEQMYKIRKDLFKKSK